MKTKENRIIAGLVLAALVLLGGVIFLAKRDTTPTPTKGVDVVCLAYNNWSADISKADNPGFNSNGNYSLLGKLHDTAYLANDTTFEKSVDVWWKLYNGDRVGDSYKQVYPMALEYMTNFCLQVKYGK